MSSQLLLLVIMIKSDSERSPLGGFDVILEVSWDIQHRADLDDSRQKLAVCFNCSANAVTLHERNAGQSY